MRLLLGCLTATPSADLLVHELPVDETDLVEKDGGESLIKTLKPKLICSFTFDLTPCERAVEVGGFLTGTNRVSHFSTKLALVLERFYSILQDSTLH